MTWNVVNDIIEINNNRPFNDSFFPNYSQHFRSFKARVLAERLNISSRITDFQNNQQQMAERVIELKAAGHN